MKEPARRLLSEVYFRPLYLNPTTVGLTGRLRDGFTDNPIPGKVLSFTIGTQTVKVRPMATA